MGNALPRLLTSCVYSVLCCQTIDIQELLDNVESLCALDRPAGGANANLSGGLLDTRAYRIKRSQLQVWFMPAVL